MDRESVVGDVRTALASAFKVTDTLMELLVGLLTEDNTDGK
jgi:hypothetical protein